MKKRVIAQLLMTTLLLSGCGATKEVQEVASPEQPTETVQSTEDENEEVTVGTESEIIGDEGIPDDMFIPESFVEEVAGKNDFESYDEVINYLTTGQAYAYVDVLGSEEPLLLVTEGTYDNMDNCQATIDASIYMKGEEGVRYASVIASEGTAYPLAVSDDGLLYQGGNHNVDIMCVSKDTHAIMYMAALYEEFDENGKAHYGGFIRTENSVEDDGEEIDTDSDEAFMKLMDDYIAANVINFTVVEQQEQGSQV